VNLENNRFFTIAHRLPGRLRCYSPLIKTVKVEYLTGSILINYNLDRLSEARLFAEIKDSVRRQIATQNQLNGASATRAVIPWLSVMHAREKR